MKVPYQSKFNNVKSCESISTWLLYTSTVITLIIFFLPKINMCDEYCKYLRYGNCILILSYLVLSYASRFFVYYAREHRKKDIVDNAFNCQIGEDKSEGYFTNDNLPCGIYRLAVNAFESCFFSYKIAREMTKKRLIKTSLLSLIFVTSAICGYNNIVILIIEISLPYILIQQAIHHIWFIHELRITCSDFRYEFNNIKDKPRSTNDDGALLYLALSYETIIAFFQISLDTRIYNKENADLSSKWRQIKQTYNI